MLAAIRHIILTIIDFFHRPFARWIDTQTFRYLACGGSNFVLSTVLYEYSYTHVFHQQAVLYFLGIPISAVIAAFMVAFCITTPIGFFLMRTVVFQESNIPGKVQAFRYMMLVLFCVGLNYVLLKFFVGVCHLYPTLAQTITSALVAIFSYISQRVFTFAVKEEKVPTEQ